MIWHRIILSNLIEAHGDLMNLQARMVYLATGQARDGWKRLIEWDVQKQQITPGILAVQMQHIYHHVNWTWNSRNLNLAGALPCSRQYFRCLFCFPRAFPELWPKTVPTRRRYENAT